MNDIMTLYDNNKLLVRAMDQPSILLDMGRKYFDLSSWGYEIDSLMNEGLDSLSTTLIVPNVGVRTYKNVGFLLNSDLTECLHISKTDSSSSGSIRNRDFLAKKEDFTTLEELAKYIKDNDATEMNEVNVNAKIDAVVGLFINKCQHSKFLLQAIYPVKCALKELTGVDYPIYVYDFLNGKLESIELSKEEEDELINSLGAREVSCWLDSQNKLVCIPIESSFQK